MHVVTGDGTLGWPEAAPFDAIVVTAGTTHVPNALIKYLKIGGRMVLPLAQAGEPGERVQRLTVIEATAGDAAAFAPWSVNRLTAAGSRSAAST